MKRASERDFATYPRRFVTYRWFKPLLVGLLCVVFFFVFLSMVYLITSIAFHTTVTSSGYDDLDFFSAAGAFFNCASQAIIIPALLLAAMIVKDRPLSSYFSSMGGWRWKIFLKTLAFGFVLFGIPNILWFLLHGKAEEVRFTLGGFIFLVLFIPLQGVAEELTYRGFIMQTVSSWFKLPVVGLIIQTIVFASSHPYNLIGIIYITITGVVYGMICVYSRGIEASSSLHILNNTTELCTSGFGFGTLTADQTIPGTLFNATLKLLFLVFIIYADKKLHWFDKVQYDDLESFNAKHAPQKDVS